MSETKKFWTVGTRSVLYGAHCWFLHPWFVAWAWWKLYGFPWDPRLWVAFFVHDLGYVGKPNMDGPEGEEHPRLGARIMAALFDGVAWKDAGFERYRSSGEWKRGVELIDQDLHLVTIVATNLESVALGEWGKLCLLHSRYYAKKLDLPFSRLCVADKLAIALTPWWLYLPMVNLSGEIHEYLENAQRPESVNWTATGFDQRRWYTALQVYMRKWVDAHKDGRADTWTSANRHARADSGVWQ